MLGVLIEGGYGIYYASPIYHVKLLPIRMEIVSCTHSNKKGVHLFRETGRQGSSVGDGFEV